MLQHSEAREIECDILYKELQLPTVFSCEVTLFIHGLNLAAHTLSLPVESLLVVQMWWASRKYQWFAHTHLPTVAQKKITNVNTALQCCTLLALSWGQPLAKTFVTMHQQYPYYAWITKLPDDIAGNECGLRKRVIFIANIIFAHQIPSFNHQRSSA